MPPHWLTFGVYRTLFALSLAFVVVLLLAWCLCCVCGNSLIGGGVGGKRGIIGNRPSKDGFERVPLSPDDEYDDGRMISSSSDDDSLELNVDDNGIVEWKSQRKRTNKATVHSGIIVDKRRTK